ncbi:MAG: NAD(P)/FAD-dependent oxidoreductase [bacterium]|nr:NAD(P)/FAD-dependent oxidoreductase [bacterium]
MRYVIIGAGAAGLSATQTILKEDNQADITVITEEFGPFYFRPMLVELLHRENFIHNIYKVPQSLEIVHWELGARVSSVEPKNNRVLLSNQKSISYDFLVIASGSFPDISYLKGFERFVRTIHSYSDVRRLKQELTHAREVIVTGGGYIAVEIIRQLYLRGLKVYFYARPDLFWPKELPGVTVEDVVRLLEGVDIAPQFDVWITDVYDRDGTTYTVVFNDGSVKYVQSIIAVPAEVPNVAFLQGSGIHIDEGIVVNEELRTNIPNVFACGDCAQVFDLHNNVNRTNFGWRSAEKQGEIAGRNAVGKNQIFIPTTQDFYFLDLLGKNLFNRWIGMEEPSNS